MKQRPGDYWLRMILFALAMVGVGMLIVVFGVVPIHAADMMSYPPRLPVCCQTPADFGLRYEDVAFSTSDGLMLHGWYIPGKNGAAVLFAHGGGGNRLGVGQLEQAAALAVQGFGVLLYDLRDHGDSDGTQTSFTGADVVAALNFLRTRSGWGDRVVLGRDRHRASRRTRSRPESHGIGRSRSEWQRRLASARRCCGTAAGDATRCHLYGAARTRRSRSTGDGSTKPMPPRPALFISGAGQALERDSVRRYFAATSMPKSLWEIPEGSHAYTWAARPQEYTQRVVDFFTLSLPK